jgi:hypothetical protein
MKGIWTRVRWHSRRGDNFMGWDWDLGYGPDLGIDNVKC